MGAPPKWHELACVVHVHSTFSDGRSTVAELLAAAAETDTDVVLLTDHDTLRAKRLGLEGWHGGVLLLVGHEVSPKGGHYLAFGLDHEVDHRGRSESEIAAAVARAGGLGFAAHPFSRGSAMSRRIGRPHGWSALDSEDLTGIELWSLVTETAERWASPLEALRFMRTPERELDGPPAPNIAAWDRLCARRRCVAIGGLDAHESGFRLGRRLITPFPNRRFFRFLRTHVLCEQAPTGDLAADRAQVYRALAAGRCFLGMGLLGSPTGFRYWAESASGRLGMGAEAPAGAWILRALMPAPAEVSLVRDGVAVARASAAGPLEWAVDEPGVYRLEARRVVDGSARTWIMSNPIYLRRRRTGGRSGSADVAAPAPGQAPRGSAHR